MTTMTTSSLESRRLYDRRAAPASEELSPEALGQSVTVVIPAYNEASAIVTVVTQLRQLLPDVDVLVVDDGSNDSTFTAASSTGVKVIKHARNLGYGAALKSGIRAAQTPFVAMFDADGQHRPEDLAEMLQLAPRCDAVIGARTGGSHQVNSRKPGKWVLGKVANQLVGQSIPDLNSGMRIIRRNVILRYLHLLPNGFSASTTTTICLLQRGYDVTFHPIRTRERVGKSTVKQLRDGFNTVFLMIRLIVLFNPLRFFLPPSILLVVSGLIYGLSLALIRGHGVPTLALLMVMTGLIATMFGLLADQISSLRKEMFEKDRY
jgi:glycosyltransferase involved in cell wall biosynthesis